MLDDAADVIQGEFGEARVAIAREQVLSTFPDGHVNVHAGAVVANDRLGHECRGLAIAVGDVMHHILQALIPVGALDEGLEFGADFTLPCVGHFMVVHFHFHANILECSTHRRTDVLQLVNGWDRKVTTFYGRAMAEIATLKFSVGRPCGFFRINFAGTARHIVRPLDGIENEEFRFRAEVSSVAQAAGFQVRFRTVPE